MKRQERRGAYADGELADSSWTEEERPESAEQPGAQRQVRRPLASTAQDDQLLLEQEILRDHRSHATGATQLRGHDSQVKQGEQEFLHARDSVGQTSGATQVASILDSARELGIRGEPDTFVTGNVEIAMSPESASCCRHRRPRSRGSLVTVGVRRRRIDPRTLAWTLG